uniref:EB domain-containing protein n=1 Tax=Strigamia maritima TaxID=126957 RepID=T1IST9_STRMM
KGSTFATIVSPVRIRTITDRISRLNGPPYIGGAQVLLRTISLVDFKLLPEVIQARGPLPSGAIAFGALFSDPNPKTPRQPSRGSKTIKLAATCANYNPAPNLSDLRNNILNGACNKYSESSQLYSRCINNHCRCIEGYNALNNSCELKTGKIGDTCKTQINCKGRFTYYQEKTCQCINGFTTSGQDCMMTIVANMTMTADINRFLSYQGNCICNEGYYMQGAACIPNHVLAFGQMCQDDGNCPLKGTHQLIILKEISVYAMNVLLTKVNQGFGASCTTDEDCYATMFCGRQKRK